MADSLRHGSRATPERIAFADLLERVAKAMHDIEWVDSCDYGEGDELPAINACITPADVLVAATERAEKALAELQTALNKINGNNNENYTS
jgi:hypothetical protein